MEHHAELNGPLIEFAAIGIVGRFLHWGEDPIVIDARRSLCCPHDETLPPTRAASSLDFRFSPAGFLCGSGVLQRWRSIHPGPTEARFTPRCQTLSPGTPTIITVAITLVATTRQDDTMTMAGHTPPATTTTAGTITGANTRNTPPSRCVRTPSRLRAGPGLVPPPGRPGFAEAVRSYQRAGAGRAVALLLNSPGLRSGFINHPSQDCITFAL